VEDSKIVASKLETTPAHEPGAFPRWLSKLGVNLVLAGGMGNRAISLFNSQGIDVCVGVSGSQPNDIIATYLDDKLQSGENLCDH